ncbi:MAG: SH3 domain-containing protein [Muribaculaceae bacterium]|nr:SH3 domain-containing protein [Muribaculaceae bacterium]
MKRIIILAVVFFTALAGIAQATMIAYLSNDELTTNILDKPRGATAMTLSSEVAYIFSLTSPTDGWWKIEEISNAEDDEDPTAVLTGSDTGEYWIHYSALGLGTRNYGGQSLTLRTDPDEDADIVFTFDNELEVMPLDVQGDWVQVMVDGYGIIGWIEAEWLCDSPLTNCC